VAADISDPPPRHRSALDLEPTDQALFLTLLVIEVIRNYHFVFNATGRSFANITFAYLITLDITVSLSSPSASHSLLRLKGEPQRVHLSVYYLHVLQ
jgi:hypothetical protein